MQTPRPLVGASVQAERLLGINAMGWTVEGRGRVSCAERAGAAFQVDQTAGAVALRPWGTWQGSPSPVQCMFWKDRLAFDWGPLGGIESQQPHGLVAGSDADSPVAAPQREWSVSWNLQSWGPLAGPARLLPHHVDGGMRGREGRGPCPILGTGAPVLEAQAVPCSRDRPALSESGCLRARGPGTGQL